MVNYLFFFKLYITYLIYVLSYPSYQWIISSFRTETQSGMEETRERCYMDDESGRQISRITRGSASSIRSPPSHKPEYAIRLIDGAIDRYGHCQDHCGVEG